MAINKLQSAFRDYVPPADTRRSVELATSDTYQWAKLRCAEPFVTGWIKDWEKLYNEPYRGITVDGNLVPGLYHLADGATDNGAPSAAMTQAAQHVLEIASPEQRQALSRRLDAGEWRRWTNPEIYVYRHGIRLEEVTGDLILAVHDLLRASLSPAGYTKVRGCMKTNHFLGEVVDGKKVLNENAYNFAIFGTPAEDKPWGWHLYGHHLCVNCFVVGTQMVISPVFLGAEPNVIDEGPDKGTELFTDQEGVALTLMQSFDSGKVAGVRIFLKLNGPEYPEGRYHRADQRHLGGAFQDNRVIPYEGLKVTTFTEAQQDLVRQLITVGWEFLPEKALKARMEEISAHWAETYFCWIGGFQPGDAFYYKVHSPVTMVEFDHHSGVFLNNKEPLPFHIHNMVRTPNGNDYGMQLRKQYQQCFEQGASQPT